MPEIIDGELYRLNEKEPAADASPFIVARQWWNEAGFTVKTSPYKNAAGESVPGHVTGGGSGDWECQDLLDYHLFPLRKEDFAARYIKTTLSRLPGKLQDRLKSQRTRPREDVDPILDEEAPADPLTAPTSQLPADDPLADLG